jgi:hypothetical protein
MFDWSVNSEFNQNYFVEIQMMPHDAWIALRDVDYVSRWKGHAVLSMFDQGRVRKDETTAIISSKLWSVLNE